MNMLVELLGQSAALFPGGARTIARSASCLCRVQFFRKLFEKTQLH